MVILWFRKNKAFREITPVESYAQVLKKGLLESPESVLIPPVKQSLFLQNESKSIPITRSIKSDKKKDFSWQDISDKFDTVAVWQSLAGA